MTIVAEHSIGRVRQEEGERNGDAFRFLNGTDPALQIPRCLIYTTSPSQHLCAKLRNERGRTLIVELGVGMVTEGMDLRSVGNTMVLHETSLIEAFNLKFAIEYKLKNGNYGIFYNFTVVSAANEALTDMPPRTEEELDPVTLHNQALIGSLIFRFLCVYYRTCINIFIQVLIQIQEMGLQNYSTCLAKIPFPQRHSPIFYYYIVNTKYVHRISTTLVFYMFINLKNDFQYYDLAADVLAENTHLTFKYLSQYLFDYLDAVISLQTSPDEAYSKFDAMANEQMNELRKLTKKVQGNFEFGISRVIKAMEPQERKLGTDTWYYAKRCLLATIETMAKHLVVIRDSVIHECISFLEKCEVHGRGIPTIVDGPLMDGKVDSIKNTVTYEARLLKALLLQVIDY
uniref:Tetratricopeptide repeat protein 30 n=1 Tax=Heterorhabditis bacteriophora TaxID=37862 RepID=A0A1I7XI89_HETBA